MGMAGFGSTFTKIGTIQRLARPLRKSDMPIHEAVHICIERKRKKNCGDVPCQNGWEVGESTAGI